MQIIQALDNSIWQHFVDNHPAGNIFHTPAMYQVFEQAAGYQPTLWAVVDSAGQVLTLFLPVQVTLIPGLLRRLTTRSIAYGSVLVSSGPNGLKALNMLLQAYPQAAKGDAVLTELRNLADLSTVQPCLNDCGFVYEEHLNYLINLAQPSEAVMQTIGKRTRKQIRHALRQNLVSVEEITNKEHLPAWYNVLQQTYQQARVPLADFSLFEAAFDVFFPKKMIKFLSAKVGDAHAAVSAELIYKDTIYGWYGGVNRTYQDHYPNELLTWHILEWGANQGYCTYDFGGAGKPHEPYGVRDFKAKFGGELVCYGRNTYIHAPRLLRLSTVGYQIYRQLRRKIVE